MEALTTVFQVANAALQSGVGGRIEDQWAELGAPAPTSGPTAPCCRCGATPRLDASFVVDPSLAATNASSYAVFQGMPPPCEFWSAVVAASCSAVVVLGHDAAHVAGFFPPAQGQACCAPHGDKAAAAIELPNGRSLRCVHHVAFPEGLSVRQLEVAGPSGAGELWVNFLHLESWPDYGVPSSTAGMLRLCRELESCRRPGARIAVQCCCGTDAALGACPAGAFIAIDMLVQRLQRLQLRPIGSVTHEQVLSALDVAELVRSLRAQRKGLVETEKQYAFVHLALADEIKEGLRIERRLMPRGMALAAARAMAAPSAAPTVAAAE